MKSLFLSVTMLLITTFGFAQNFKANYNTDDSKIAFGISVGAKFRADPNKLVVKNGKYFLFLYDLEVDAQQLWLAGNHDKLL